MYTGGLSRWLAPQRQPRATCGLQQFGQRLIDGFAHFALSVRTMKQSKRWAVSELHSNAGRTMLLERRIVLVTPAIEKRLQRDLRVSEHAVFTPHEQRAFAE